MKPSILIIGGGYAGVLAAQRLARRSRGRARVTLINADDALVERIRNHELAAARPPRRHPLASLLAGTGAELLVARVAALHLAPRQIELADGTRHDWDRLVCAWGGLAGDGPPGAEHHACSIAGETGAQRLRQLLDGGAGRVVVIGGGLTGLELAAEVAAERPGSRVSLVTPGGVALTLGQAARAYIADALRRLGVTLVDGRVTEVGPAAVTLADGRQLPFEACAWSGGFRAPPLAARAGLAVNERGQLLVDASLRSRSHEQVYAIGDAACVDEPVGAPLQLGCKYAMPMAAHLADSLARELAGGGATPFRYGDSGFCVSLGRRDGVVQINHADGRPRSIITGRGAAWLKERICRYTIWSLRLERHGAFYRWSRPQLVAPAEPRRLAA